MLSPAISSAARLHKYQFNVLILYGFIFSFWQTSPAMGPSPAARQDLAHSYASVAFWPGMILEEGFLCN
jgi:hypothetical protein